MPTRVIATPAVILASAAMAALGSSLRCRHARSAALAVTTPEAVSGWDKTARKGFQDGRCRPGRRVGVSLLSSVFSFDVALQFEITAAIAFLLDPAADADQSDDGIAGHIQHHMKKVIDHCSIRQGKQTSRSPLRNIASLAVSTVRQQALP
jgi:hypothetical protein